MLKPKEAVVTINLVVGEPIVYKVEATEEKRRNAASRIEKAMNSNYFGVRFEDRLVLVPMHNIRSVEISPPPVGIITNVANDVQTVD